MKIFYFINFISSSEYPPRLGGHRTGWLTVTNQAPVLVARASGFSRPLPPPPDLMHVSANVESSSAPWWLPWGWVLVDTVTVSGADNRHHEVKLSYSVIVMLAIIDTVLQSSHLTSN